MQAKLPICVSDNVTKENPNFINLLSEISALIDGDGTSKDIKKELQNVR